MTDRLHNGYICKVGEYTITRLYNETTNYVWKSGVVLESFPTGIGAIGYVRTQQRIDKLLGTKDG